MKKYLILFAAMPFFIVSCDPEDDKVVESATGVELTFKANYSGDAAPMQKEFTYADGNAIKFVQMDFYISNVALMKDNSPESPEVELTEIDFVDLTYTNEIDAMNGYTIVFDQIPTGSYAGLKIGIGVPADLNRDVPEDYGSTHPLNKNSHYWEGWSSYIFAKIEAGADLDGDGEIVIGGAESEGLSYHTGTDEVYQEVIIAHPIDLVEDQTFKLNLNVDLNQVFLTSNPDHDLNGDGYLDIDEFRGTHTNDKLEVAIKMMENLANSITLDF